MPGPETNGIWTRSSSRSMASRHYLWRAVDQNGVVIDILVQPKRDRFAAMRFFRKLLRATGRRHPRVIITDKLRSYAAAKRVVMPGVAHRQHRYLNNRAENSHQPTRERERRMRRFKSAGHAQRFVEVHGIIGSHFRPRRHLLSAADYRRPPKQTISNLERGYRGRRARVRRAATVSRTMSGGGLLHVIKLTMPKHRSRSPPLVDRVVGLTHTFV